MRSCASFVSSSLASSSSARDDDVQRRRMLLHRADLHRRRVHAQEHLVGDVERVGLLPRRMVRVVVEGVEVVVDELDLWALGHSEPEAEEDVLDLAARGGDEMQPAGRQLRVAGQGDVDGVGREAGVELARVQGGGASLELGLDRLARLIAGLAHGAALVGRQVADAAQELGQLGLAAEVADPDLLQARGVGGLADFT